MLRDWEHDLLVVPYSNPPFQCAIFYHAGEKCAKYGLAINRFSNFSTYGTGVGGATFVAGATSVALGGTTRGVAVWVAVGSGLGHSAASGLLAAT